MQAKKPTNKFRKLIKDAVEHEYGSNCTFIDIVDMYISNNQDKIHVNCKCIEKGDKSSRIVGTGIGIYPEGKDFVFFHSVELFTVKAEDIWADIKHLFGNPFDIMQETKSSQILRESIVDKKEEIAYLKAKIITMEYEAKQKKSDSPF